MTADRPDDSASPQSPGWLRWWVPVAWLGVLVAAVGVVAPDAWLSPWRDVGGFVVVVLGAVVAIAGLALAVRHRNAQLARCFSGPLPGRRQRRQLGRQISGRDPVDVSTMSLARGLAMRWDLDRPLLLTYAGMLLVFAGQTLSETSRVRTLVDGVLVVFSAVLLVLLDRQARRARRFLDTHPVPATP